METYLKIVGNTSPTHMLVKAEEFKGKIAISYHIDEVKDSYLHMNQFCAIRKYLSLMIVNDSNFSKKNPDIFR